MRKKGLSRRLVPTPDGKQKYSVFVIYFIFFFFFFRLCEYSILCVIIIIFNAGFQTKNFGWRIRISGGNGKMTDHPDC